MGTDLLILTVYFIVVVSVLYQMALSVEAKLEDQVAVVLDKDTLQSEIAQQLGQQNRYDAQAEIVEDKGSQVLKISFFVQQQPTGAIALQILPQGKRPLEPPINNLSVNIVNTLPHQQVFVNWDNSSITLPGGMAHRVIRQVPGSPVDLLHAQVMTVVNPGQRVSTAVTSEHLFNRPADQALDMTAALIPLKNMPDTKEPLRTYSLRLLLWVQSMNYPNRPAMQLLLPFNFRIDILPDHVALPVLSWLLDFFSTKPKRPAR
jgi:hypothetical protein